jgi:hypothetical protein
VSLLIGLAVGCVGIDPVAGHPALHLRQCRPDGGHQLDPDHDRHAFALSANCCAMPPTATGAVLVQEKVGALFRGIGA